MKDIPLSSYVYFAQCELDDASDNLDTVLSRLDDDLAKSLISDVLFDINNAIDKLNNLSL